MASATVRIAPETLETLRYLSEQSGETMPKILAKAVEVYRRRTVLELTNVAFAALKSNAQHWEEEMLERDAWDTTLADAGDGQ